ncbi:hypothetical protein ANO11243_057390 [Dothideomycetidae sp. 11243]|nr:hypothetical protein ANO11243_057390 [fungal sp. No.11243]
MLMILTSVFEGRGWLTPLAAQPSELTTQEQSRAPPTQPGEPHEPVLVQGWQRIVMVSFSRDNEGYIDHTKPRFAWEGVVMPGGNLILGRWWDVDTGFGAAASSVRAPQASCLRLTFDIARQRAFHVVERRSGLPCGRGTGCRLMMMARSSRQMDDDKELRRAQLIRVVFYGSN